MPHSSAEVAKFLFEGTVPGYPKDAEVVGKEKVPALSPVTLECVPDQFSAFNDLGRSSDPSVTGVHFYKSDDKFANIILNPQRFAPKVSNFKILLTPDITIGAEMPDWMRIRNTVASRMCGVVWERHGLTVVPSLRWVSESDCDFVALGVPRNSVFAVSTYGSTRDKLARRIFEQGLEILIDSLSPECVLVYGPRTENLLDKYSKLTRIRLYSAKTQEIADVKESPNHAQEFSGLFQP